MRDHGMFLVALSIVGTIKPVGAKTIAILNQQAVEFCGAAERFSEVAQKENFDLQLLAPEDHSSPEPESDRYGDVLGCRQNANDPKIKRLTSGGHDPEEFSAYLLKLSSMMKNGRIQAGDRILLQINSHGNYVKNVATFEVGHQSVPISALFNFRNAAERAGVRLAIIDGSCFSGHALELGDDKTCVISAQDRFHEAGASSGQNGTFSEQFWTNALKHIQSGRSTNLEEIFLETRSDADTDLMWKNNRPEISAPVTRRVRALMDLAYLDPRELENEAGREDPEAYASVKHELVFEKNEYGLGLSAKDLALMENLTSLEDRYRSLMDKKSSLPNDTDNDKLDGLMSDLRQRLVTEEKKVYQSIYLEASQNGENKNPCQGFNL